MTEPIAKEAEWTFAFPANADSATVAAYQRTAATQADQSAVTNGLRLTSQFEQHGDDAPVVAVYPDDFDPDDYISEPDYRPIEDGEQPTHYVRTLRASMVPPEATPETPETLAAARVLDAVLASQQVDRTEWTADQFIDEAHEAMKPGGPGIAALTDEHIRVLLGAADTR